MADKGQAEQRTNAFRRNVSLEEFLAEINQDLWATEERLLGKVTFDYPVLFIMGPHRSGTTLILQWLASLGGLAYPTNMLSRFYQAPVIGAKIQQLLTAPEYNFRNEILDFTSEITFTSENGKTKGALSPNEFWYFWRRFLPESELDCQPTEALRGRFDGDTLKKELAGLTDVFQKPFALKAMIMNYNIDLLNELFPNALFIYSLRDPLANIVSALKARERQLGSLEAWYSFIIPEYAELKDLSPIEQVAGQIYYLNRAVENGLAGVPAHKKLIIPYEAFCTEPGLYYQELRSKLAQHGCDLPATYSGESVFQPSSLKPINSRIRDAYSYFVNRR